MKIIISMKTKGLVNCRLNALKTTAYEVRNNDVSRSEPERDSEDHQYREVFFHGDARAVCAFAGAPRQRLTAL
jgi:hypothetical protein